MSGKARVSFINLLAGDCTCDVHDIVCHSEKKRRGLESEFVEVLLGEPRECHFIREASRQQFNVRSQLWFLSSFIKCEWKEGHDFPCYLGTSKGLYLGTCAPNRIDSVWYDKNLDQRQKGKTDHHPHYNQETMDALERWLIRESIRSMISPLLRVNGTETEGEDFQTGVPQEFSSTSTSSLHGSSGSPIQSSIVSILLKRISDFPLFRKDPRMADALRQMFELLPRLESALKARKGSTSLEKALVGFAAGPIVSAARAKRTAKEPHRDSAEGLLVTVPSPLSVSDSQARNGDDRSFSETILDFLEDILKKPSGVKLLLEELKSAHSVSELRPCFRELCEYSRKSWAQTFIHAVRKRPRESKATFERIPKLLILAGFKLRHGNTATTAAVQMMFFKPLGSPSLWQRFLMEALNIDAIGAELERVASFLSPRCQALLTANTETLHRLLDEHTEDHLYTVAFGNENLSTDRTSPELLRAQRDIVLSFLERTDINVFEELSKESQKWAALRFVELVVKKSGLDDLVTIMGNEEFTAPLKSIFSSSKTQLADSLFAKGSGLVKLVEEVFTALEVGFRLAEGELKTDDEELERQLCLCFEPVQFRLLTVAHNVLLSDPDLVIHESISWLVDQYRNSRQVDLPSLEVLSRALSDEHQAEIAKEAELVRRREEYNLKRPFGATKLPRPKLIHSKRLISTYCQIIDEKFLRFPHSMYNKEELLFIPNKDSMVGKPGGFISDIELTWTDIQDASVRERGYVMCGYTGGVRVWWRGSSNRGSDSENGAHPLSCITGFDIDHKLRAPTLSNGDIVPWTYLPRNLNKGVFGTSSVFFKYKRARDVSESTEAGNRSTRLVGLYVLDASDERNDKLAVTKGWKNIVSFRNSLIFECTVWVKYA